MALIISPSGGVEADTLATVTGRDATTTTPIILNISSTSDALRVTQTGTGNALLVEDSTNPDSSPFVIDGSGKLGVGTLSPRARLDVTDGTANISGDALKIVGITGATVLPVSTNTGLLTIQSNDSYAANTGGSIAFGGRYGSAFYGVTTGANWAYISGFKELATDGSAAGYLQFATRGTDFNTVERMRITSAGGIAFGGATNYGTTGQVLTSQGNASPIWTTPSGTATTTYTRTVFTATAAQTVFSAAYTVGYVEVYLNGLLLPAADYTATNGTSVTLGVACAAGDIVETIAYAIAAIGTGVTTGKAIAMAMIFGG